MNKITYIYPACFNGVITMKETDSLTVANNNSYWSQRPYIRVEDGMETTIQADHVMTDDLIDGGFHNRVIRKNKQ